jgi:hypothetical protein
MKVLGRAERVDLPEYGFKNMPAKVDTGAYSSSIDCEKVELLQQDSEQILSFVLLRPGRDGYTGRAVTTKHFDVTEVTNANGVQKRFVIFTDMIINGQTTQCRFTLTDRSKLRYPVLIGRRFIREAGYMVDVTQGQGLPDDEEDRNL